MPHQLMATSTGNSLDFEGEIDVFKYRMVPVAIKVLYQPQGIFRITVVADGCDLCDGLNRFRCRLNKCYFHFGFPSFSVFLTIVITSRIPTSCLHTTFFSRCSMQQYYCDAHHIFVPLA